MQKDLKVKSKKPPKNIRKETVMIQQTFEGNYNTKKTISKKTKEDKLVKMFYDAKLHLMMRL